MEIDKFEEWLSEQYQKEAEYREWVSEQYHKDLEQNGSQTTSPAIDELQDWVSEQLQVSDLQSQLSIQLLDLQHQNVLLQRRVAELETRMLDVERKALQVYTIKDLNT